MSAIGLGHLQQLRFAISRDRRRESRLLTTRQLLMAFTVARLALVPLILVTFTRSPGLTSIVIALFVATDVYDGVLARRHGEDGPARRALDSAVDRLTIDSCLIGACIAGVLPPAILLGLLARDAYLALICSRMMRTRRVAIKADWLYRALNLSVAGWALLVPFVSAAAATALALLLLAFSLVVAIDLTLLVKKVLSAPPAVRDTVIGAGALRGTADLDKSALPQGARPAR